ncbi:MAG: isochorismatase family cysteine hydrolase [Lentisphaerota bacterium]
MAKIAQRYALVVVDMQNDLVMPGSPLRVAGAKATVPVIVKVLKTFREHKLPIFHTVREYRPDGSDIEITRLANFIEHTKGLVPGTKGCEIVEELRPVPGEYKLIKNRFSAFMSTELDFMLRRLDINHIILCGTQYPSCIRATAFDSICYGYHTTVLTDATSAKTAEIAESNIRDMKDIGIECVESSEFFKKLRA